MRYLVTASGETRSVELTEQGVRLDGDAVHAELVRLPGTSERHLRLGNRGLAFTAERVEGGWEVQVAGRRLRLVVEDERSSTLRALIGPTGRAVSRELAAPMPGLILKVFVEPGQVVATGDPLVVIEAMKMENELRAEGESVIESVFVREGQTVGRGDVLVSFATEPGKAMP